ncbi:GTPase IMAP family member 7 isoform 2-T2 [Aulostomus maculatus]
MSAVTRPQTELRLVVLGRVGSGRRTVALSILGLQDSLQCTDKDDESSRECTKLRGEAAGRQVVVVSSPDWFSSDCNPEERKRQISSVISLSSPGPHAFLLCVPINQPTDGEAKALDVMEEIFGPSAVSRNTILLFTHLEELAEDEQLEDYLITWRKDLQAMLERCSGRYHTLETWSGDPVESEAVKEMLEKVEQAVKERGMQHFSCPLYQEAEERLRMRQVEIVRQRRGESSLTEEDMTKEDFQEAREEAEISVGNFSVDVESLFPPDRISPSSSTAPSFLWGLWENLAGWIKLLPRFVRKEALLGALVGLFVGGPFGGMVGATVGSVAMEMGRRNTHKSK